MKPLPENVKPFKRTPTFDETSVPAGLLKEHSTAGGVWGVIKVQSGHLVYRINDGSGFETTLDPDNHGVIEPQVKHHVSTCGPVSFYVEFNRTG